MSVFIADINCLNNEYLYQINKIIYNSDLILSWLLLK